MPEEYPRFSKGQNVKYISTNKVCTVNEVKKGTRGYSYKVTLDGVTRVVAERFLEAFEDVEESIINDFSKGRLGTHDDYRLFQTWFRLSKPLETNLYSYLGSKTIFNPHQFKPLLRFLSPSSDERLFIADEVGVGKTIEAGIILTELLARGRLTLHTPIMIVCPHSLCTKWIKEMKDRFNLYFTLLDGNSLRHMLKTALKGDPFPQSDICTVVGLQLLRQKEYYDMLEELSNNRESSLFSMIIIDECHHMRNTGTDNNEIGNLLSSITDMMLMLSATPLNLRSEDLYNQMHILNPGAFPDQTTYEALQNPVIKLNRMRNRIAENSAQARSEILTLLDELETGPLGKVILDRPGIKEFVERLKGGAPFTPEEVARYGRLLVSLSPMYYSFTRTRKREALEHQVQREVLELPIDLSEQEMKFQEDVLRELKDYYLSSGVDSSVLGFILNTHRRMLSSCIPAMKPYLEWCLRSDQIMKGEALMSEEVEDDSQADTVSIGPELRRELEGLLKEVTRLEKVDSKYNQFKVVVSSLLFNPETPQVMIFSFFIRTLKYLRRRLVEDGFTVGLIHGEVPQQSAPGSVGRDEIMDAFKRGEFQILLSSEVGGEGLDFQYCRAIINYDLPYNPMRVEQRIGRIDRFGQKADKVIVVNLFIRNTVDEEIYDRLYRRIHLVEEGIGTLEPILGKEISDIQAAIITGSLSKKQIEERTRRLEQAVAAGKVEMEEFEKHRGDLLSDDYLTKPINNIPRGDFISPEDAIQLTEQCLSKWNGCKFVRAGSAPLGEMYLSNEVSSRLEQFLYHPGNEAGYGVLKPLTTKKRVKVVFDGRIAEDHPDHIFLSPTGYWTRFLSHELEEEKVLFKTFGFGSEALETKVPAGEYIVFLFEVRMEGIRREIDFLGVPVNISSEAVAKTDFANLPRDLSIAAAFEASPSSKLDPVPLLDIAEEYLEKILEERIREASEANRYKVESRIAALERASLLGAERIQQQLDKHIAERLREGGQPDEQYVKLTRARLEKIKSRLDSKEKELREHQELSADHNLQGIIYLKLGGV